MSLKYLNGETLGNALACAWQHNLGTTEDPANGQWYTNGPNNDGIGLYGGLTDSIPQQLQLDTQAAVYSPQQILADTAIVDNRNGLNPSSTVTLSYQYTNSIANTHSSTMSVEVGTQFTIGMNEIVAQGSAQFSLKFTFSSTETESKTTSETQTFTQSVPVSVPAGKVYQAVLTAESQQISIPYTVPIQVTGTTETWFEDTVNGHYNWSENAGTAFGWINQYTCAGTDSRAYSDAGGGMGAVTLTGTVSASQVANFKSAVYDITAHYNETGSAPTDPADVSTATVVQTGGS